MVSTRLRPHVLKVCFSLMLVVLILLVCVWNKEKSPTSWMQGKSAENGHWDKNLSRATDIKDGNGASLERPVRILCWILTDPDDLDRRTQHVRNTWTRRCDVTLFMSSAANKLFPAIGLNVTTGRDHIASKAKAAWKYIYRNHFNDAEFFLKADPDTFVILENLRLYLANEDCNKAEFYGHRFTLPRSKHTYMSGGAGLVVSREALRRLVTRALPAVPDCMPDGQGEDYKTARCLLKVGAVPRDTRDETGRETFLVFPPSTHLIGQYPDWYYGYDMDGALKGPGCCSDYPISFHYIKALEMYSLQYLLYQARIVSSDGTYLPKTSKEKINLRFLNGLDAFS